MMRLTHHNAREFGRQGGRRTFERYGADRLLWGDAAGSGTGSAGRMNAIRRKR